MEYRIVTKKPPHWDSVVSHPLQSWAWGDFRIKTGVKVVRIGKFIQEQLTEGYQITFHSLPKLPFAIGYFPKGPALDEYLIQKLAEIGNKEQALFIQNEPNIFHNSPQANIIKHQYLKTSHHPLFTKYNFILDLNPSEEELLKAMHPKTRYNIKVAQKHDVTIQEDSSTGAFAEYLRLSQETTARQGFYAHTPTYHTLMWETLSPAGMAKLFTATYQDMIVAAWIIFVFGDTVYYPYGASSREYRETQAPTLLLWEIARWAKQKGHAHFDLWGAMGPDPDMHDPWYGFHRFKEGFAPRHVTYIDSQDLVIKPTLYSLYCLADTIRWSILKMKRSNGKQ